LKYLSGISISSFRNSPALQYGFSYCCHWKMGCCSRHLKMST